MQIRLYFTQLPATVVICVPIRIRYIIVWNILMLTLSDVKSISMPY